MSPTKNRPSLHRILTADYISFVLFINPFFQWAWMGLLWWLECASGSPACKTIGAIITAAVVAVSVIFGLTFLWYVGVIRRIFSEDFREPGCITRIQFRYGIKLVELTYRFEGREYRTENFLRKEPRTLALKVGDCPLLVIEKDHPTHVFIQDLYL